MGILIKSIILQTIFSFFISFTSTPMKKNNTGINCRSLDSTVQVIIQSEKSNCKEF